jgi:hypothetical protein
MKVSGPRFAYGALFAGNSPPFSLDRRLVGIDVKQQHDTDVYPPEREFASSSSASFLSSPSPFIQFFLTFSSSINFYFYPSS